GDRTAPVRARDAARRWNRYRAAGRVCGVGGEAEADASVSSDRCPRQSLVANPTHYEFSATLSLHDRLAPVFERFLHFMQELVGDGAVHHAVVVAERHVADGGVGN